MDHYRITADDLKAFEQKLYLEEKARATILKYKKNLEEFFYGLLDMTIDKKTILQRKEQLLQKRTISTANGILTSVNRFFRFLGYYELCLQYFKRQKRIFAERKKELTKREYERLVQTAKIQGNERLHLLLQTICATGIRVSELQFITVETVFAGYAEVQCKGKLRTIFLPRKLQRMLKQYLKRIRKERGPVFATRTGKPIDRSNIWAEMKKLCDEAEVAREKVFPHNLRHLFARTFYNMEKDIAKLADLLGHASIETTRIYIMESGEEHRRKLERMHLLI